MGPKLAQALALPAAKVEQEPAGEARAQQELRFSDSPCRPDLAPDMVTITGIVRSLQRQSEPDSYGRLWSSWFFLLERGTPGGPPLPPVPVRMYGRALVGSLNEGDRVQLLDRWRVGEILQTTRVHNLTTGTLVWAQGGDDSRTLRATHFAVWFILLSFLALWAIQLLSHTL